MFLGYVRQMSIKIIIIIITILRRGDHNKNFRVRGILTQPEENLC